VAQAGNGKLTTSGTGMSGWALNVLPGLASGPAARHYRPASCQTRAMPDEEPLAGGNVSTGVVRIGDTVRRPAGPWTPAIHALLTHLRAAGLNGSPEPLGIDDKGREVLRFIPGTVAWGEGFRLLQPARELARAGRLIRDFHDAVAGFVPPADAHWQVNIPPDRAEIIAHHDLAPWNLVIGDQWTFIDWDMAAPGSRLWDLAWASLGFIPLSADPQLQAPDAAGRLLDSSGIPVMIDGAGKSGQSSNCCQVRAEARTTVLPPSRQRVRSSSSCESGRTRGRGSRVSGVSRPTGTKMRLMPMV
jgi:Phosphotransferase enzyme family